MGFVLVVAGKMSMILLEWILKLLLLIAICGRYNHAQNQTDPRIYGPNYCLLSRLDVVPCQNFYPALPTPDPGVNQYSIYRTVFGRGPAGLPICYPVGPPGNIRGIQDISSIGIEGQVKFLYSPGYPGLYGNQELATYNVQCPVQTIAFLYIPYVDTEPANCLGRCVDYITIDHHPFDVYDVCGNDSEPFFIESNSFSVQFRSSPSVRHHGFRAVVVCYRDEVSYGSIAFHLLQALAVEQLLIDIGGHSPGIYSESLLLSATSLQLDSNSISRSVARAILESASPNNTDRLPPSQCCMPCDIKAECLNDGVHWTCTCQNGFYGSGLSCVDYDECLSGNHNCSKNAKCTNTPGDFDCSCHDSYFGDGFTCLDIENSTCNISDSNCFCHNGLCGCGDGYQLTKDNHLCADIDECLNTTCGHNQVCVNTPGSYMCVCTVGYIYNNVNKTCVDFDECAFGRSDCSKNGTCTNLDGSFECACSEGFIGDGRVCYSEKSECEDVLDCQQFCIKASSSFQCSCNHGYVLALDGKSCQDIDECALHHNCDENAFCSNLNGSFTCTCNEGYYGNGHICIDINECKAGQHHCHMNATCLNTVGSFTCQCDRPFFGDGFMCRLGRPPIIQSITHFNRPNHELQYPIGADFCLEESMDEYYFSISCTLQYPVNPVPRFQFFVTQNSTQLGDIYPENVTSETSHILTVNQSFSLSEGIEVVCNVSNIYGGDSVVTSVRICGPGECQDGVTNNCTQLCTRNSLGNQTSYDCSCEDGLRIMDGSDTECVDIDECVEESPCTELEECFNIDKSYSCDCVDGYRRDASFQCADIDECQVENLCPPEQQCINTNGSFDCSCYEGFVFNLNHHSCINVNECESNLHNCFLSEHKVCIDTYGSFSCECEQGYINVNDLCEDLDECLDVLFNNCSHMCANTNGSYACLCQFGYSLSDDGKTCEISIGVIAGIVFGALVFIVFLVILLIICFKLSCWHRMTCHVKNKSSAKFTSDSPSIKDLELKNFTVQSTYKLDLPRQLIIRATNLQLLEAIGQGEFGIVYKGYIRRNMGPVVEDIVAIKTLKGLYDHDMVKGMLQECSKMCDLDHPNVLSLTGVCLDGGSAPYIIMPFMTNGSLLSYLKKRKNELVVPSGSEQEAVPVLKQLMDMCLQVARGMEYIASKKIIHRDLAARNCMMSMNFVIKVADFGLAVNLGPKHYFRQDKTTVVKLPLRWLAPESIHEFLFSEKSDVWAYGVTCWEIFSGGMLPYAGLNVADLPDEVQKGKRLMKPYNVACSDQMYSIMNECWELESDLRPTFATLVKQLSVNLESISSYMVLIDKDAEHSS